jgi:hypothetical protein
MPVGRAPVPLRRDADGLRLSLRLRRIGCCPDRLARFGLAGFALLGPA